MQNDYSFRPIRLGITVIWQRLLVSLLRLPNWEMPEVKSIWAISLIKDYSFGGIKQKQSNGTIRRIEMVIPAAQITSRLFIGTRAKSLKCFGGLDVPLEWETPVFN